MSDRDLVDLAAKAASVTGRWDKRGFNVSHPLEDMQTYWEPLENDGDALRLAVKLNLEVLIGQGPAGDITRVRAPDELDLEGPSERHGSDACAATRRAIVRAAAEIGKGMDS
ncbi:hypothetical protein [Ralstonia mannitolilytica]|uniref:hypothetical protein n=1 Tax=Ralstonia mannitolilytica TaxID=105219 RepID=UPI000DFEE07A|nr:hypothetical protein [Ralstonia mannitolilytica]SUD94242.1 Uncharacterised protein [Ralstonia mannitolilytica]